MHAELLLRICTIYTTAAFDYLPTSGGRKHPNSEILR
ncbi:hypothetical protein SOVF_065870 [Spinacia oleracea]|nr:hypothetical protein SOVF_065870 [Spinacia oleracea]